MEKNSNSLVEDALARLGQAVTRLSDAAGDVPELRALAATHAELQSKLGESERQKAILREAANRVAARLDTHIARLSAAAES